MTVFQSLQLLTQLQHWNLAKHPRCRQSAQHGLDMLECWQEYPCDIECCWSVPYHLSCNQAKHNLLMILLDTGFTVMLTRESLIRNQSACCSYARSQCVLMYLCPLQRCNGHRHHFWTLCLVSAHPNICSFHTSMCHTAGLIFGTSVTDTNLQAGCVHLC